MIANTIVNTKIIGFNFSIMTNCILILLGMIVGLLVKMWNILRFVFFVKYSTPWFCLNLFKLPSSKLHLKTVSRLFFNRYGLPFLFQRHMQDKRVLNTKKTSELLALWFCVLRSGRCNTELYFLALPLALMRKM